MNFRAMCRSAVLLIGLPLAASAAETWPQFRGPRGDGHAAKRTVPMQWSETENVRWKTPIAGLGWSSPVVAGEQIWLTTAIEAEGSLRAVCVDRGSGQVVHDVEVFKHDDLGRVAAKNSHASPTPVLDGRFVFVHFGAHGTACLTDEGQVVWRTQLKYDHRHGPGGSPVVWGDLLIVACDSPDEQFLVALDKRTGEERWRVDHQGEQAYSTATLAKVAGASQLIASRGNAVIAYAPGDGSELWRCSYTGHSVVPRPVVAGEFVYCCTGYWNPSLLAIRLDGSGDVTASHVAFTARRGVPFISSPIVVDGRLYMTTDLGVLTCLDALTGKELWHERLSGNFSASPTYAGGKIYLQNEEGTTFVLKPGATYDLLATNHLECRTLASPAFVDGAVYLRSDTHLYRIEQPGNETPRNVRAAATLPAKSKPPAQKAFKR